MEEFSTAFTAAEELWISEIYPASEPAIVGVSGERLARLIRETTGQKVHFVKDVSVLPQAVAPVLRPGDIVMTLGAGAIGRIGNMLLSDIKGKHAAAAI